MVAVFELKEITPKTKLGEFIEGLVKEIESHPPTKIIDKNKVFYFIKSKLYVIGQLEDIQVEAQLENRKKLAIEKANSLIYRKEAETHD